jgi:hypothetical protein
MKSKSKAVRTVLLVLVLCFTGFSTVAAQLASGQPDQDTYISGGSPTTAYGTTTTLWARLSGNASNVCSWTRTAYLQWNLDDNANLKDNPSQIGWVGLSLARSASGTTSNPNGYVVSLYKAPDNWDNTTTWNTAPSPQVDALIMSKPFPASNGAALTFNSDEAPELLNYVRTEAASTNHLLSLAIRLDDPENSCPTGVTTLIMDSSEATSGTQVNIDIRTAGPPPNAVDMTKATAERVSWPLYAGLAAVALFAVGGVIISRRRTA